MQDQAFSLILLKKIFTFFSSFFIDADTTDALHLNFVALNVKKFFVKSVIDVFLMVL